MFKNLKLAAKLALGFAVPLIMLAGIVILTYLISGSVKENAELAKDESAIFAGIARQMKLDTVQVQQWLTDISATRAQDGLDDGFDEAEKSKQSYLSGLEKFREMYRSENNQEGLRELDELEQALETYYEDGKTMAQAYIDGGPAEGNKYMDAFDKAAASLTDKLDPFVEQQTGELDDAMIFIVSSISTLVMSVLVAGLIAVVLGIVVAWLITRSITKPINRIIEGMTEGADQVSAASGQISQASQQLAEGANEQASGLEESSSSLEEMASMTKQNADNAKQANTLAGGARDSAEKGTNAMKRMSTAIEDIKKSSDETAKIIKTIDEIAFQTNLLALNAAVEAARAGEAGKGFAVVAEEVRNLAQRSAEAAKNTSSLIEESKQNSDNGVKVSQEVGTILGEIVGSVSKVTDLVGEVAAASEEQSKGIDQVNSAVAQMDKVTQQNASNAEESASGSEELNAQAAQLKDMVGELVALVGGSAAQGNDAGRAATAAKAPEERRQLHTTGQNNRVRGIFHKGDGGAGEQMPVPQVHADARVVKPEEVIPLDDKDFGNF